MLKRILSIALIISLLLPLCACGEASDSKEKVKYASEKELYKKGTQLVRTLCEMVESDDYRKILGVNIPEDLKENFQNDAYDEPSEVYRFDIPAASEMLSVAITENENFKNLSDDLKEQLEYKMGFSAIITAANGKMGSDKLAFSTAYTANKKWDSLNLKKETGFIYFYDEATPVVVLFGTGGHATAQFIFINGINELKTFIKELDTEFKKVNISK